MYRVDAVLGDGAGSYLVIGHGTSEGRPDDVERFVGMSRRRAALLEAMVPVGHRFGLAVTAEGVETRSQADLLRGSGCDLAQGWLFGRPIPPGEVRFRTAGR